MATSSPPHRLTIHLEAAAHDVTLAALERFFTERTDDVRGVARDDAHGALYVELHPAGEPLSVTMREGTLAIDARTGTVGPGYHAFVVDLIDAMAAHFALRFEASDESPDDTGYVANRDFGELKAAFARHLAETAETLESFAKEGGRGFSWGLAGDHRYTYAGLVATPLGPRDEAFVRDLRTDPERAREIFAWWSRERDAAYFRGLALSLMWTEVRWRRPLDDEERALLDEVVTNIERAHGLDQNVPLPWAAQSEIFVFLGEESLRATRAHLKAQSAPPEPAIGYRRGPVQVDVGGGFWISIPGELQQRWEDRATFVAFDSTRSLWVTTLTLEREGEALDATETLVHLPPLDPGDALTFERDDLLGVLSFTEATGEDGLPEYRAEAHAAHGPHAAVGTLVFTDPEDRSFVLETWGSITFRP